MKEVSVIILEDSVFLREALSQELEKDASIHVVGKASNAYEARDLIISHKPDALISDINLGTMSGAEFVRQLLPQYYLSVVFISSDPANKEVVKPFKDSTFILKPQTTHRKEMDLFYIEVRAALRKAITGDAPSLSLEAMGNSMITIGASTGGVLAIGNVIEKLPAHMPPIVIAQHMPQGFTKAFSDRLNTTSHLSVKEAAVGDILIPGQVYIAPGGYNTTVQKRGLNKVIALADPGDMKPIPNIDVLFTSVAQTYMNQCIAILLTGMGRDGAQGMSALHDTGASTIAQDKDSCVVYGMPKAAVDLGCVDYELDIHQIAAKCVDLLKKF